MATTTKNMASIVLVCLILLGMTDFSDMAQGTECQSWYGYIRCSVMWLLLKKCRLATSQHETSLAEEPDPHGLRLICFRVFSTLKLIRFLVH